MSKIPETVIESIKTNLSFLSLLKEYNIVATKKGSSHFATCPFHDVDGHAEKTPSLSIDIEKNIYHCFSCEASGNVIQFVQEMDKVSFPKAVEKLFVISGESLKSVSGATKKRRHSILETENDELKISSEERETILRAFVEKTTEEFRNNKAGRQYLEERGLDVLELLNSYAIGFCPSNLYKNLISREKKKLEAVGLLKNGRLIFEDCIIFPLIKEGRVSTIYSRRINNRGTHYLLPTPLNGLYLSKQNLNPNRPLFLTESIIDSHSLFTAGITNTLPLLGINGFLSDHKEYLKQQNFPKIYTAFDGDEAGRRAAVTLSERLDIEIINFPDFEDCNTMLIKHGASNFKKWIVGQVKKDDPEAPIVRNENGFIFIQFESRVYRVQGLSTVGMDRLKVTLKLYNIDTPINFHMDSIDLYQVCGKVFCRR